MKHLIWLISLILLIACEATVDPADTIVLNGNVITVDDAVQKAQAIAIKDGKIIAVGSASDIMAHQGANTTVIDAKGQTVLPGFIEGHGHFMGMGTMLLNLNLMEAKSFDDILQMTKDAVAKAEPGQWIIGRGWHQDKWDKPAPGNVNGFPRHDLLSAISPENPVYFRHASGHMSLANQMAMDEAGITDRTPNPPGGTIEKDEDGEIIGIFNEKAQNLVGMAYRAYRAKMSKDERKTEQVKALKLASDHALKHGVTSFHDAGATFKEVDLFKESVDNGDLQMRLWVMIRTSNEQMRKHLADYAKIKRYQNMLTVGGVKKSLDGAMGSRGAWLIEPYSDNPSTKGLQLIPMDSLRDAAQMAFDNGLQMCTHAIGDRANRETLNLYGEFHKKAKGKDLRWRIEHSQHVQPVDIPRFKEYDVIASFQANHCTSDGPWVPNRLGEPRTKETSYRWKTFWDQGTLVMNGTDVPVEPIDIIDCYHSTVTRLMKNGKTFYPEEKLDRMQALQSYTINNAKGAFEEDMIGSISVGKMADLVFLDQDITTVADEKIRDTKVLKTMVGGKVVYEMK